MKEIYEYINKKKIKKKKEEKIPRNYISFYSKEFPLNASKRNNNSYSNRSVINFGNISKLINGRLKIKKIQLINNKNSTRNLSNPKTIIKDTKNSISFRANKSCGEIANEIAKMDMDYYLNGDNEENVANNKALINLDKILNKKDKDNYLKDKANIIKSFKNNSKKIILKCVNLKNSYSQDNIKLNSKNNKDKTIKPVKEYKPNMRFSQENIHFNNPINSCNAMYQNKIIYNNIINKYTDSMISEYEKIINNLNPVIKLNTMSSKQKINILPNITKKLLSKKKNDKLSSKFHSLLYKFGNKKIHYPSDMPNTIAEQFLFSHRVNRKTNICLFKNSIKIPISGYPGSRIDFSFAQEKEDYIMYGGFNTNRVSNLWKFNPDKCSWDIIKEEGGKNESRYGHSAAMKNRNLFIFGGKLLNQKVVLGDLEIFNLDTKKWYYPNLRTSLSFPLRKNHIGCFIGNQMFIYGGIDENGEYLNDCHLLNYKPLEWLSPIIDKKVIMPYLAYHSCCLVVPQEMRENSTYSIYNIPLLSKVSHIKEKGLYIFGGKTSKNGTLNKNLYVLRVGQKPLEWVLLKTKGSPPSKRYATSMSYYENGNIVIIHGGRNNCNNYDYILNDTFVLNLHTLNWMKVEYFYNQIEITPRFFHQSFIYDNYFFAFGGTNGSNYLGSEMLVLDLDSNEECLKEREELEFLRFMNQNQTKKK